MNVKCDIMGLLTLAVGGLLVSSMTTVGIVLGLPLLAFGLVAGTTTAWRVRNQSRRFTNGV